MGQASFAVENRCTVYVQDAKHKCNLRLGFEVETEVGDCIVQEEEPGILKITAELFDAYLKCPTKCFLRFKGEMGDRTAFAEWLRARERAYLDNYIECLSQDAAAHEHVLLAPPMTGSLKRAKWLFGVGVRVYTQNFDTVIQIIERSRSTTRRQSIQVVPIRFTFFNKLSRHNRLQLAFDSMVLSQVLGHKVRLGKIIHGDNYDVVKVKADELEREVRKLASDINLLLSKDSPPDLALNQHCSECEFQAGCRQKAIERDDLSLLSSISEKERKKFNSEGIFTITHLSYTFRPRRKPRRYTSKREKYHHSLKALAIRQHKIHVVGREELKIEGTPVYLDVESIPDRNFYYLIGARVMIGDEVIQHSLWADTQADERKIWNEFIEILSRFSNPVIIHYGSFETTFLKQMYKRYGGPEAESTVFKATHNSLNLLSFIYARVYFPTYSNGLKEIAGYLKFSWAEIDAAGIQTIIWRMNWEQSGEAVLKQKLITYNGNDCEALYYVTKLISRITEPKTGATTNQLTDIVDTDSLPREGFWKFRKNQFCLKALEEVNRTAYWDYQHEKVILRGNERLKKIAKAANRRRNAKIKANKTIHWPLAQSCPECGCRKLYRHQKHSRDIFDIRFGKSNIKRWVTHHMYYRYKCTACGEVFFGIDRSLRGSKYGPNLAILATYLTVEMRIPQTRVATLVNEIFGINLPKETINRFKAKTASIYEPTYENIIKKISSGRLVHADETKISLDGKTGYVWAFTNMENVAYLFSPSREGELVQTFLKDFKGVLISDFFGAYESISCPQQKCLIHLIRDLNDDLMKEPFNEEFKMLTSNFADLIRSIVATIDRFGLKARFLHKHKKDVDRFFESLCRGEYRTEVSVKWKKRFTKNRYKLFTFLDYDGIPWNNNNAEHAIKSVALLRRELGGISTEKGIRDYLILLSVCETCRYYGIRFLDFLRSGERDIDIFIDNTSKVQKR